jgi:hypothetical protein
MLGILIEVEGTLAKLYCHVRGEYTEASITLSKPVEYAQDIEGDDARRLYNTCRALQTDAGERGFEVTDNHGVKILTWR